MCLYSYNLRTQYMRHVSTMMICSRTSKKAEFKVKPDLRQHNIRDGNEIPCIQAFIYLLLLCTLANDDEIEPSRSLALSLQLKKN